MITSADPSGGSSTWKTANIDGNATLSVQCSPQGRCIAIDPNGNAFTAAHPARGRQAWSSAHVDAYPLTVATCPSPTLCVAGDGYGYITVASARR